MTDPRERRRQRAAAEKEKVDIVGVLKKFRVPIIITILWALLVGVFVAQAQGVIGDPGEECPVHWHAGYSVWVDDRQLSFDPRMDSSWGDVGAQPGAGFHLHADNPEILHMHPGTQRCIALGDMLERLDVEVQDGRMVVSPPHVQQGTYEDNETHEVVVYHQPWQGSWRKVGNIGSFMDSQIGDGDRVMVAYVDATDEALIQSQQDATYDLSGGSYEPPEEGGFSDKTFINITMATIFAILAIVLWYNFAKKTW